MQIRQAYSISNKLNGFSEYQIPRTYHSFTKIVPKLPQKDAKRQTIIDSIQKISRGIPGPADYATNPQNPHDYKKYVCKIDFTKLSKQQQGKKTYVDDEIKNKKDVPGIGKYDVNVYDKSLQKNKSKSMFRDKSKSHKFRPTVMDGTNIDTLLVSPGSYNISKHMGKSTLGTIHPANQPKKSPSLPSLPSAGDYNPIPVSYSTFSQTKSKSHSYLKKDIQKKGKSDEKALASPGPKYSLILDWGLTKGKNGKAVGQNYLSMVHTHRERSIYH